MNDKTKENKEWSIYFNNQRRRTNKIGEKKW